MQVKKASAVNGSLWLVFMMNLPWLSVIFLDTFYCSRVVCLVQRNDSFALCADVCQLVVFIIWD